MQKGEAEKPRSSVKPSAAETARAEAQTHVPVLASTQALDVKEVAAAVKAVHDEARRIAFTAEQADSFKMVTPALLDVLASLAKERRPAPLRADKDPALTAESKQARGRRTPKLEDKKGSSGCGKHGRNWTPSKTLSSPWTKRCRGNSRRKRRSWTLTTKLSWRKSRKRWAATRP